MTPVLTERAAAIAALRVAAAFNVKDAYLKQATTGEPKLLRDAARIAALEVHIRALLWQATPLPVQWRAACPPVLGNVAEAIVESILADVAWLAAHASSPRRVAS